MCINLIQYWVNRIISLDLYQKIRWKFLARYSLSCGWNRDMLKKFAERLILTRVALSYINKKRKTPFALSMLQDGMKGWIEYEREREMDRWKREVDRNRDDERIDSGTRCAGTAEVLEEALRFWVMTLFESRSRIVNGASGSGVISHLDLSAGAGDKSALNKICRRHSGEIKGTKRGWRCELQDAPACYFFDFSPLMRFARQFMPELMSSLKSSSSSSY